ncbi:carbohydrate ABC transporter permease [Blautia liquoris]|uniref:Carbohydrate ABC transporter permease n=1 Tax=Blautia liquoris TaxID=2779518 RepID=A0A7M2RLB1_9FIRM|nr:carbohydrate ABC transporter permease [Blautia liquoris]QOV20142.1 carbohydrate ABC transporter permease [Blautia liquoris]
MTNKTAKKKHKISTFSVVNGIIFILICLFILIPIYKVVIDSLDLHTTYGMKLWPEKFGLAGYRSVFSNPTLYRPLLISLITTIAGTALGLLLCTLGGYVLIQWDMPGRNFLAGLLLFTMIFEGGMIPTYLVVNKLHMTNTLFSVIFIPAISIYNLVLMRNFFEGIPQALFEAAEIDGCSPMQIFYKIVLPLSKAALASIGLMFAVTYWNDYTNFKIYITNADLYNFQMKLRSLIMGSDLPTALSGASENTVKNAAVMVAIIPFMIIYPFCQKYFISGINMGAVKE